MKKRDQWPSFRIESLFHDESLLDDKIIQDTMNISRIMILSPVYRGVRNKDRKHRGAVKFKFSDKYKTGRDRGGKVSPIYQVNNVSVLKREVKVLRDDWSNTDTVDDVYTIANKGETPLKKIMIRTELFRDELEIFDNQGRKLPFESRKAEAEKLNGKELKYSPYSFLVSLHSPLEGLGKAVIRLRYKIISENSSFLFQFLRGLKDALPFTENEGYLYRFFEIGKVFGDYSREFTFAAKLSEGTTATSYVILGVGDSETKKGKPSTKVFDCKYASSGKTLTSGETNSTQGKRKPCEAEDETNFYCEGRDLFFALSKAKLDKLKYLVVIVRISPQTRIFFAISSIQLLTVSILVTLALEIHSQPFSASFSLVTGLFLALLTLLLYPERSRLMDTRISDAIYSVILSTVLVLHALSIYIDVKVTSYLLNRFLLLHSLLIYVGWTLIGVYILYCLIDWGIRRDKFHSFIAKSS